MAENVQNHMALEASEPERAAKNRNDLIEGVDYELENGLLVLTRSFLLKRGHCCGSGCRNCPYTESIDESGQG